MICLICMLLGHLHSQIINSAIVAKGKTTNPQYNRGLPNPVKNTLKTYKSEGGSLSPNFKFYRTTNKLLKIIIQKKQTHVSNLPYRSLQSPEHVPYNNKFCDFTFKMRKKPT